MQCNFPGIDRVCTFFNSRLCVPDHTHDCVFVLFHLSFAVPDGCFFNKGYELY